MRREDIGRLEVICMVVLFGTLAAIPFVYTPSAREVPLCNVENAAQCSCPVPGLKR